MIYMFMKRPAESDNPLLKFTKYQRQVLYQMYRQYGQGEIIGGFNQKYGITCLIDSNETAVFNTRQPDKDGKYYLKFTFDGEPFAEITTSGALIDITCVKWLDVVSEHMGGDGDYLPYDDNLPNYDVLTDEERENYQQLRLNVLKGQMIGEFYNGSYVVYDKKNYQNLTKVYLGVRTHVSGTLQFYLCLDPELKKPIAYVQNVADYTSPITGQKVAAFKLLLYCDPTFNSAPKDLRQPPTKPETNTTLSDDMKEKIKMFKMVYKPLSKLFTLTNLSDLKNPRTLNLYTDSITLYPKKQLNGDATITYYLDDKLSIPFVKCNVNDTDDDSGDPLIEILVLSYLI